MTYDSLEMEYKIFKNEYVNGHFGLFLYIFVRCIDHM